MANVEANYKSMGKERIIAEIQRITFSKYWISSREREKRLATLTFELALRGER